MGKARLLFYVVSNPFCKLFFCCGLSFYLMCYFSANGQSQSSKTKELLKSRNRPFIAVFKNPALLKHHELLLTLRQKTMFA